jgi:hypothetical protein
MSTPVLNIAKGQNEMSRKEDREAAQKKFRDACKGAGLSELEMREFSKYMHNQNLLEDYMSYDDIKKLAREWAGRSGYNPYKD